MRKLLLAAAMVAATTPALAGITDDFWVKKLGIGFTATAMCGLDNADELLDRLAWEAVRSTGASRVTVIEAAKTYGFQVVDHLYATGNKITFCRNIYNGNW